MTIFGWDASHYDAVPDMSRVVHEGFAFMTHKAGGDKSDAELAPWWRAAKPFRDRILLGAYWVLYPGIPEARADAFLARLDDQCPGWRDGPFILQLDCERWNNDNGTVPGLRDIRDCCDQLKRRVPALTPIVYAPKWVYGDSLSGLRYPLWASSYVNGTGAASQLYPGDGSSRWKAYSGQVPAILQFTSSATIAGQTTCDANAYRGTLADLIKLLAPGWEVDDMPSVEEIIDGLYQDLSRNPGTTDKDGQSGLNRLFRQFSREETAAIVKPVADKLNALQADVDALQAAPPVAVTEDQLTAAMLRAIKQLAAEAGA